MKSTKIMLACVAVFIITYLVLSTVGYLLSDYTFKQVAGSPAIIAIMVIVGWIPSVVVGVDLEDRL